MAQRLTASIFASPNPTFLDADYAVEEVIGPCLDGLGERAAVVLLQFPPQRVDSVDGFTDKLHRFLEALPNDVLYALELRNPELLSDRYLEAIRDVSACHCFNVHPTMPSLEADSAPCTSAAKPRPT